MGDLADGDLHLHEVDPGAPYERHALPSHLIFDVTAFLSHPDEVTFVGSLCHRHYCHANVRILEGNLFGEVVVRLVNYIELTLILHLDAVCDDKRATFLLSC